MAPFNGWTEFLFKWARLVRHAAQCLESSSPPTSIMSVFSLFLFMLFSLVSLSPFSSFYLSLALALSLLLAISFSVYNLLLLSTIMTMAMIVILIPLNPKDTFTVMCFMHFLLIFQDNSSIIILSFSSSSTDKLQKSSVQNNPYLFESLVLFSSSPLFLPI